MLPNEGDAYNFTTIQPRHQHQRLNKSHRCPFPLDPRTLFAMRGLVKLDPASAGVSNVSTMTKEDKMHSTQANIVDRCMMHHYTTNVHIAHEGRKQRPLDQVANANVHNNSDAPALRDKWKERCRSFTRFHPKAVNRKRGGVTLTWFAALIWTH